MQSGSVVKCITMQKIGTMHVISDMRSQFYLLPDVNYEINVRRPLLSDRFQCIAGFLYSKPFFWCTTDSFPRHIFPPLYGQFDRLFRRRQQICSEPPTDFMASAHVVSQETAEECIFCVYGAIVRLWPPCLPRVKCSNAIGSYHLLPSAASH